MRWNERFRAKEKFGADGVDTGPKARVHPKVMPRKFGTGLKDSG